MIVLPPGRLSITTGWPQSSLIFCPIRRATMSLGAPAGKGTITRSGLLGKAADVSSAAAMSPANMARTSGTRTRPADVIVPSRRASCSFGAILPAVPCGGNRVLRRPFKMPRPWVSLNRPPRIEQDFRRNRARSRAIPTRSHVDAQCEQAQDRLVRSKLLIGGGGHPGPGALVGQLAG